MSDTIENRLQAQGITLPQPVLPAANYVPAVQTGNLLFLAGQLPYRDGKMEKTGVLGRDLEISDGKEAAKWCAVNLMAQAKAALGDLARIKRVVKLTVFVASTHEFGEQPAVANGASDLFVAVFGDIGKHARSAVGMAALPFNAPVEVEAIFEVADA